MKPPAGDQTALSPEARDSRKPEDKKTLVAGLFDNFGEKSPEVEPSLKSADIDGEEPVIPAGNAERLRDSGVPERLSDHPGGPPTAPAEGFGPEDIDPQTGKPRTGTLYNEFRPERPVADTPEITALRERHEELRAQAVAPGRWNARERDEAATEMRRVGNDIALQEIMLDRLPSDHRYATLNALPPGLNREQATDVFNAFNAPTAAALDGEGNPTSLTEGWVDPSGPFPAPGQLPPGLDLLGGKVEMNRGETAEGNPWAINTTIPGKHPLNGHITRTMLEHDGQFYIRTDGVGVGDVPFGTERDLINSLVGPATFNNLDAIAAEYARERYLSGE